MKGGTHKRKGEEEDKRQHADTLRWTEKESERVCVCVREREREYEDNETNK